MRVFNLTDVRTDVLEQRGLVDQHIAVAGRMINPGEYADVESSPAARANIEDLVRVGALAIDQPPPPYVLARQQIAASGGATVRQHLNVQETKVAGEPVPGPAPEVEGEKVVVEKHDPASAPADESPAPALTEDPPPNQPPPQQQKPSGKKPSR